MKNYFFISLLFFIIIFNGCEKVAVIYPGNTQEVEPKPPKGSIIWSIDYDETTGNGQLEENSSSMKTIGILDATDPNPDDEFTYVIDSQKEGGIELPSNQKYFSTNTVLGVTYLITSNNNIDFESLSGSKKIDLVIRVEDNSSEPQSSDFSLSIEIINVNEDPYFINFNSIPTFANEYIKYEWEVDFGDTDIGDNPIFNITGPDWLKLESSNKISGTPTSEDVGPSSFILTVSDGENDVTKELNIDVRENTAPYFENLDDLIEWASEIRDGCYKNNETIFNLIIIDDDGVDDVLFTVDHDIPWLDIDENGNFRTISEPLTEDKIEYPITLSLDDRRPTNNGTFTDVVTLIHEPNSGPQFLNTPLTQTSMSVEDGEVILELEFSDPEGDPLTFTMLVDGFESTTFQWIDINQSGQVFLTPDNNDIGTYQFSFSISDGCNDLDDDYEMEFEITN